MKLFLVGVVFLVAVGFFVWMGILEASIPHFKIHELKAGEFTEECRIDGGKVLSVESRKNPLTFTIYSPSSPTLHLRVTSPRNPPDNFFEGCTVALRGKYDPQSGEFHAEDVTTACPSKYEDSKEAVAQYPAASSPEGESKSSGSLQDFKKGILQNDVLGSEVTSGVQ